MLNADAELADDLAMTSPAFCTTYGLCHSHVAPAPFPGDDIINQVPLLMAGMHPGCLLRFGRRKTVGNR